MAPLLPQIHTAAKDGSRPQAYPTRRRRRRPAERRRVPATFADELGHFYSVTKNRVALGAGGAQTGGYTSGTSSAGYAGSGGGGYSSEECEPSPSTQCSPLGRGQGGRRAGRLPTTDSSSLGTTAFQVRRCAVLSGGLFGLGLKPLAA